MIYLKMKRIIALVMLLTITGLASALNSFARTGDGNRTPDLPSPLCDSIQAPTGNKVAFHAYALGVQVYRWNGTAWVFVEPVATLFADSNYQGKIGIHYAGPT